MTNSTKGKPRRRDKQCLSLGIDCVIVLACENKANCWWLLKDSLIVQQRSISAQKGEAFKNSLQSADRSVVFIVRNGKTLTS